MNTTGVRPEALARSTCPLVCSSIVDMIGSSFSFSRLESGERLGRCHCAAKAGFGFLLVHAHNAWKMNHR
jgi:hypothetical protein